jgi:hypothetical protein
MKADGTELEASDHTAVTNNFLHSLFSQCTITLNGVTITPAAGLYGYRAYLETLLTVTMRPLRISETRSGIWIMAIRSPTTPPTLIDATNKGFIARWNRIKQNKEVEFYGRLHC